MDTPRIGADLRTAILKIQQGGGRLRAISLSQSSAWRDRIERLFELSLGASRPVGFLAWLSAELRDQWLGARWVFLGAPPPHTSTATIVTSRFGRQWHRQASWMTQIRHCLQLSPSHLLWLAGEHTAAGPWLCHAAKRVRANMRVVHTFDASSRGGRGWQDWWQACQHGADNQNRILLSPALREPRQEQPLGSTADRAVMALSRIVIGLHRRRNGAMENLWDAYQAASLGQATDLSDLGEWEWPTWDAGKTSCDRLTFLTRLPWPSLCHWVRDCPQQWPGETVEEWRDRVLLTSCSGDHRSPATLLRILQEKKLRGSSRLLPVREPMVCWTERQPSEWSALRVFRPHLSRWDFVPYGIAVARAEVLARGGRPIRYADPKEVRQAPLAQQRFLQPVRSEPRSVNWSVEAEWRSPGDFPLADVPNDRWAVIVPHRAAARRMAQMGHIRHVPFLIAQE